MAFYASDKAMTNHVAGAVAAAALHDLHVNGFTFHGFPSVTVGHVGDTMEIRLHLGGKTVGPMTIPLKTGEMFAKAFREKQQVSSEWFKKIQGLLQDLEQAFA